MSNGEVPFAHAPVAAADGGSRRPVVEQPLVAAAEASLGELGRRIALMMAEAQRTLNSAEAVGHELNIRFVRGYIAALADLEADLIYNPIEGSRGGYAKVSREPGE